MYVKGEGVPKDGEKAALWMKRTAVQGDIRAQFNLGILHARGMGISHVLSSLPSAWMPNSFIDT